MARGGARPGSGRLPLGEAKKQQVSVQLAPDLAQWLTERAAEHGISRSQYIAEVLEGWRESEPTT